MEATPISPTPVAPAAAAAPPRPAAPAIPPPQPGDRVQQGPAPARSAALPLEPLSFAAPAASFDAIADRLLADELAAARHAFATYAGLALAAAAPDAPDDLREHWSRLQEHAAAIQGDPEFLPVSFAGEGEERAFHLSLAGGPTGEGAYRLVDPLTGRHYEGGNRAEALGQFLDSHGYPAGRLRYRDDAGAPQELRSEGPPAARQVATGWGVGSAVAFVGSLLFPPAAPVLLPVAASGLVPAGYLAVTGLADVADRLDHGQRITWDRWALGAAQVVGTLLGAGAVAGALSHGSSAALAAAAGAGASEVVLTPQRVLGAARFLLAAGLAETPAEAEAVARRLEQAAARPGQDAAASAAAVYRVLAARALRGE